MTTDELKKEAEEKFKEWKSEQYKDQSTEEKMEFVEHLHTFPKYFEKAFNGGYLASAEPREKRIAELEATCNKWFEHLKNREEELLNELYNQNGELTDKMKELEAQIKKMTELEALAKDCIENHTHRLVDKPTKQDIYLREESIFIQGYRQSEKRIAELEKENAELKADNDARKFAMAMSEKVEKQLREENAELKGIKDVATLIRANNDTVTTLMQLNNMLVSKSQQLTKAKNLLQKVADVCGYPNYDIPVELYANIADFLKVSEVEK